MQVVFQRVMGSKNPGEIQAGSPADLYLHFFDIARTYVPPFEVFNHKLSTGRDDAGEHGIHLRWPPLQLSPEQYAEFRRELRESTTSSIRGVVFDAMCRGAQFCCCRPEGRIEVKTWTYFFLATNGNRKARGKCYLHVRRNHGPL